MNRAELRLTDAAASDIQEQAGWYEQRTDRALAR
jgi:plasmid stabilization system protein ParE